MLELSSDETTAAPDFLRLIEASSLSMLGTAATQSSAERAPPLEPVDSSVASWCTTCNFRNNHHATGTIAPRAGYERAPETENCGLQGPEAPEGEERIECGETVVTKRRVTNAGDG